MPLKTTAPSINPENSLKPNRLLTREKAGLTSLGADATEEGWLRRLSSAASGIDLPAMRRIPMDQRLVCCRRFALAMRVMDQCDLL
jgi:hypothetical protein